MAASVYACGVPIARALCAQRASTERHRWVVGTCSLHESNELSVLDFDEDLNQLEAVALYAHPDQVWAVETSPKDAGLVVTSRQAQQQEQSSAVTLWRLPPQADASSGVGEKMDLVELSTISSASSYAHSLKWHSTRDSLLVAEEGNIYCYSIAESKMTTVGKLSLPAAQSSSSGAAGNNDDYGSGAVVWDPSAGSNNGAVVYGANAFVLDSSSMSVSIEIPNAHGGSTIRDVDFNPNKPQVLLTCGNDRSVRFWDLRNTKAPLKVLSGHSHWVSCCRYNPFHDQLLLTGGSDNILNLWRVSSCSSSPPLSADANADDEDDAGGSSGEAADIKVRALDTHEDSIYSAAWSAADAWVFVSLSYDGRVVLNQVPSQEKYKILL